MSETDDILFETRGAVGLITLNRPKALNALTHGMVVAMQAQLKAWAIDDAVKTVVIQGEGERAFCAGGDIRALYESGKAGTPYIVDFYRDEYLLNAAIKHYPKPYVALLRGIVMGGGVGVSVHGSHRVADETTLFAMPETGIGLFPDVGGSFFLTHAPVNKALGTYIALTGARLKTADAIHLTVATDFVPAERWPAMIDDLCNGRNPDDAILSREANAGTAPVGAHWEAIEDCFALPTVEAILDALDAANSDWTRETAKIIRSKSPTATKLALRQLREGAKLGFDDCMRMEFRMVNRVIAGHEFYEGVRATIIDKDGAPKWRPATLADVSDAEIDAYFAPLGEKELPL